MRIIAGTAKGTNLNMAKGDTRPTADRVKESLFQVLGPYFAGGRVLDLFAGTGALGLEALSRGADEAIFVDHALASVKAIHCNLERCHLMDRGKVLQMDAFAAVKMLLAQGQTFDYIFLDPPYFTDILNNIIDKIYVLLKEKGILIIETSRHNDVRSGNGFICFRELAFADTLVMLQCKGD